MAKVFFWAMSVDDSRKNDGNSKLAVGHLSLQLSNGTYISHWPRDTTAMKKGSSPKNTLDDDIRLEGRDPDETLKLPGSIINENRIETWWKGYRSCAEYQLLVNNCGQVVRKALVQGGIEETIPWYNRYPYYGTKWIHATLTPHDCLAWIKYMKKIH